jgi:O-antigen/teichoic acid export membrane protein
MLTASEPGSGLRRNRVLGAAFLSAQALLLNAVSLFTTAFIVRRLGSLQYGEWAAAASLAAAHLAISNLGLRTLFVRDVSRRPGDAASLIADQLGLRLALGAVAGAIAMLICVLVGYPPTVIACMAIGCVWILVSVLSTVMGDVLQALERFDAYSRASIVSGVAVTLASVLAILAGGGPIALTVAYLAAPVVGAALLGREVRRHCRVRVRWDWATVRKSLSAVRLLGANVVVSAGRDRAEQLNVPALVGLKSLGIFSAGTIVADRLGTVPDSIATAFFPGVSRAAAEPGDARVEPARSMLTLGIAACAPMAVAGHYLAGPIAGLLLPAESQMVEAVIQITVLAVPMLALSTGMTFCLQAGGHHDSAARSGIGASLVSLAVSGLSVAAAGIVGASWSLVARPAILTLALTPAFRRVFPGALGRLPVWRILVSLAGLAAVCQLIGDRGLVAAVAYSTLGFGVYAAGLFVMRVFNFSDVVRLLSRTADRV